jgi:hypothetical protein
MIQTWLVQIGSMAGLFRFAFTVFDRLLAGRPIISLSRSEYGKRNVRCSNPSMSEILIRSIGTFPATLTLQEMTAPRALSERP